MPAPTSTSPSASQIAGVDFRPAKLSLPILHLWQACLPMMLRRFCAVDRVEIPADDVARLKSMQAQRLLIAPNHPTNSDPALLFALSKAADLPFYYLACRENFDGVGGMWGKIIQRLGAYSVVRGTADRESFRATRALLGQPGGKVVIFPEGEVYSQNDTLLPFQAGVTQLAFWALEDLRKAGDMDANIALLPVAVRYRFTQDMTAPINASLQRLEEANRLPSDGDLYTRLRRVGIQMIETLETEYGLKVRSEDADDLTPRMNALKNLLLERAAALIGATLPADATLPERMRALINAVSTVTQEMPSDTNSQYRERLHRQQAQRAAPLMQDLNRVANWIAVQDNYVRAQPTPERIADNLRRLEVEAFGSAKLTGRRRALVRVGEPIPLAECYPAYRADKRGTVARITHELEQAVQSLLNASAEEKDRRP